MSVSENQAPSWMREPRAGSATRMSWEEEAAVREMLGRIARASASSGAAPARQRHARAGRTASAAPATRSRTRTAAAPATKRRRRFNWRRLLLIVVFVYTAVGFIHQQFTIARLHRSIDNVQAQINALKADNQSLTEQAQRYKDPAYIEQKAREMGFVKPGEVPYTPTAANGH